MTLNGKKSQLLQICFCRTVPVPPSLTLGGEPVPVVDAAKGLGFILDKDLSFNEQVHSMVTKASRRLYYLRLLTKQGMSVSDLTQVYLALIRPVLEYGHVLLVGCSKQQELAIERVQRRALRIISLGGRREVPNLPTLRERRELAAVKLLKAMLNADHPLHDLVEGLTSTGRPLRNAGGLRVPMARTSRLQRGNIQMTAGNPEFEHAFYSNDVISDMVEHDSDDFRVDCELCRHWGLSRRTGAKQNCAGGVEERRGRSRFFAGAKQNGAGAKQNGGGEEEGVSWGIPSGSPWTPPGTWQLPGRAVRAGTYHTPHGSIRETDRAPDGSLTETGRQGVQMFININYKTPQRRPEHNQAPTGSRKGTFNCDPDSRRTLGVMPPAGVYAEDMPNGRRFKLMNRDEGGYKLSHVWDCILAEKAPPTLALNSGELQNSSSKNTMKIPTLVLAIILATGIAGEYVDMEKLLRHLRLLTGGPLPELDRLVEGAYQINTGCLVNLDLSGCRLEISTDPESCADVRLFLSTVLPNLSLEDYNNGVASDLLDVALHSGYIDRCPAFLATTTTPDHDYPEHLMNQVALELSKGLGLAFTLKLSDGVPFGTFFLGFDGSSVSVLFGQEFAVHVSGSAVIGDWSSNVEMIVGRMQKKLVMAAGVTLSNICIVPVVSKLTGGALDISVIPGANCGQDVFCKVVKRLLGPDIKLKLLATLTTVSDLYMKAVVGTPVTLADGIELQEVGVEIKNDVAIPAGFILRGTLKILRFRYGADLKLDSTSLYAEMTVDSFGIGKEGLIHISGSSSKTGPVLKVDISWVPIRAKLLIDGTITAFDIQSSATISMDESKTYFSIEGKFLNKFQTSIAIEASYGDLEKAEFLVTGKFKNDLMSTLRDRVKEFLDNLMKEANQALGTARSDVQKAQQKCNDARGPFESAQEKTAKVAVKATKHTLEVAKLAIRAAREVVENSRWTLDAAKAVLKGTEVTVHQACTLGLRAADEALGIVEKTHKFGIKLTEKVTGVVGRVLDIKEMGFSASVAVAQKGSFVGWMKASFFGNDPVMMDIKIEIYSIEDMVKNICNEIKGILGV
ncbi:Troponin I, slow skeletal muscle [Branchiostoma belcheri]|nr:Troponin I, slow skeletal muscle [Branchiostoma belcheri]